MNYSNYRRQYQLNSSRREKQSPAARLMFAAILILASLFVVTLIVIVAVSANADKVSPYIARSLTVEAGRSHITSNDFLIDKSFTTEFSPKTSYSLDTVGKYKIYIILEGETYVTELRVVDTVPPIGDGNTVAVRIGKNVSANQCVTGIYDATEVSVAFKSKPNLTSIGRKDVIVLLTDGGGNVTEVKAVINVIEHYTIANPTLTVEAGSRLPDIVDFTGADGLGSFIDDISAINMNVPGTYTLKIMLEDETEKVNLIVRDTIAPIATVSPQNAYLGRALPAAANFVSNIIDATAVTASYEKEPTLTKVGQETAVRIVLTDSAGNRTVYDSTITLRQDNVAPALAGTHNLETYIGDAAIPYRTGVSVIDDSGECTLTLDTSKANLKIAGVYPVDYVATDEAGNTTRVTVQLTVRDLEVTQVMLNDVLAGIAGKIINSTMSKTDMIKAVYYYVKNSIKYVNDGDHTDWRRAAYYGLAVNYSGDCFTFYSASYALFQYLGIQSIQVEKDVNYRELAGGTHFWSLVNIGTADTPLWYHFDATPHIASLYIDSFLLTDRQMRAYTKWRNPIKNDYYYQFDSSLYPSSATNEMQNLPVLVPYYD